MLGKKILSVTDISETAPMNQLSGLRIRPGKFYDIQDGISYDIVVSLTYLLRRVGSIVSDPVF